MAVGRNLAWNNLGSTRSRLGDEDGALAAYLRAAEIDPRPAEAQNNAAAHRFHGPPRHILRLPYERMVADTEAETRRVIAHSRGQAPPADRSGTGR